MSDFPPEEDNEEELEEETEEEDDFLLGMVARAEYKRANRRQRATQKEMQQRAIFLVWYASRHGPVTVRQLFYQAVVAGVIEKTASGYMKIQRQVLELRRMGLLKYEMIADATRWMRKPDSFGSIEEALHNTALLYRKALWKNTPEVVEVWCEKDALAGVIYEITEMFDVPLMVARGFSSETFCYEAIAQLKDTRPYHVYYLGDFDLSGIDAAKALHEKLYRFAEPKGIEVHFTQIAVTIDQIVELELPTREPKPDKRWDYSFACDLDAMPPDEIRSLVQSAIECHLSEEDLRIEKIAEESERQLLAAFAQQYQPPDDPTEE